MGLDTILLSPYWARGPVRVDDGVQRVSYIPGHTPFPHRPPFPFPKV